jgi:AraC-like DNA-binding protein
MWAEKEHENSGTLGAVIQVGDDQQPILRLELVNGRHYSDARNLQPLNRLIGDGASVETIGECVVDGEAARVDILTVDVPAGTPVSSLKFRDLNTPASFVIFDVFFEIAPAQGCPFKSKSGGVALSELGAVVRVGDRVRLRKALDQLEEAIRATDDLDEAKGEALTFIAVVSAATIEMGGSRTMHRVQLEAARRLDSIHEKEELIIESRCLVETIAAPMICPTSSPSAALIDRALSILNRNFAKEISDNAIADQLGLSTSHFRYLFKEVTGQPFHRYLIALRLERARKLLLEGGMPVSEVAASVGFHGLAHFSRAFAQRFSVSPTSLRRGAANTLAE